MATQVYINYTQIPNEDIKTFPKTESKIEFNRELISYTGDFVLDNTTGDYSDTNSQSIFYGVAWLDKPFEVYDDSQGIYTWVGRIKNIEQNDKDRTVTVKVANYVQELVDITCVYADTSVTPAEAIYNILKDVVGVPDEFINYSGFQSAINIQTDESATIDITFEAKHNKNCMAVIEELLKISSCYLYTVNNILQLYQWEQWDGNLGTIIKSGYIIPQTFSSTYDEKTYNAYSIAYDSSGTATRATGSTTGTNADKVFVVPDEDVNSTTSTDYRILFNSKTGADWSGNNILTRYENPIKTFKIQLDYDLHFIKPNEQIDLYFGDFIREPCRITELSIDVEKRLIDVGGEFLNLPVNIDGISRDTDAPSPSEIYAVLPKNNGLMIKWTQNLDSDLLGYYLYFTAGQPGQWNQENCNYGKSPIEIKTPDISDDGYCYVYISELQGGAIYYTKITAFDTSYNESLDSNIVSNYALEDDNLANWYYVTGEEYTGITLSQSNVSGGTAPDGFSVFGSAKFGTATFGPAGIWESPIYQNENIIDYIHIYGYSESDGIDYQIKLSDDGITWDDWGSRIDATGNNTISIGHEYMQIRFLFKASSWGYSDKMIIRKLEA